MNTQRALPAVVAMLTSLWLLQPVPALADVTEAQIVAARSPADHEAIAKIYDADAASAEAKSRMHQSMAGAYGTAGGPKVGTNAMVHHCNRLSKEYTALAAEYRALAAEHRKMATEGSK